MTSEKSLPQERGITTKIVELFITSRLSVLLLIASFLAGFAALALTPREEEPQIIVPVADVLISAPGTSAEAVEKLIATPLESLLRGIDGVEYVYSASRDNEALVTVRFYVGEDREDSLLKVWSRLMSHQAEMAPQIKQWRVTPIEIDDVPIVTLTLSSVSDKSGTLSLRRVADELKDKFSAIQDAGNITVTGGEARRILITPDPGRLGGFGLTIDDLMMALKAGNLNLSAGTFDQSNHVVRLDAGPAFEKIEDVKRLPLRMIDGKPLVLQDVATIQDGEEELTHYTRIGFGAAAAESKTIESKASGVDAPQPPKAFERREAVTLGIAKRKGANAVTVAEAVMKTAESAKGSLIPEDMRVTVTRNNGETADHKVNELVKHLLIAIVTIVILLAFALGPKEAFIVALAVPMTLGVTLLMDLIFGYTINRVTLFALILSLGLLVDDPIVDVENIFRHFKLRREPPLDAALSAIEEVRPPTIFATFTVIVSFLPMFFITGMMGPYMAPMAFNVPVAMLMSLLVAFTVTPWATYHLLQSEYGKGEPEDPRASVLWRLYEKSLGPMLKAPTQARLFLIIVFIAFVLSALLAVFRVVPLKLLPFDNKTELALVIDMPRGSTLEKTDALARDLEDYLLTVNEVTDVETYVGTSSPMDFNGMVRHYYLRGEPFKGEMRINLLPKEARSQQSHEIALRIRNDVKAIAKVHEGNVKIVESPPGPPVLSTFVAEVYGPLSAGPEELADVTQRVSKDVSTIEGIVDVDNTVDAPQTVYEYRLDRLKAAEVGITVSAAAKMLQSALSGTDQGTLRVDQERQPLTITLRLKRGDRSSIMALESLKIRGSQGQLVALGDIGTVEQHPANLTIYHKNLRRLHYVTAEMVGREPVEAVLDFGRIRDQSPLPKDYTVDLAGEGEWKITVDVFRDLGLAFGAALLMIYVLLVAQTGSLGLPLIIMVAIPLTVIGIMPGFWLLNSLFTTPINGIDNPILFTATAMIGMIALAGIVVRNSIILIDFIARLRAQGLPLEAALIEAGATRMRPIFLTAGAALFGSFIITLDPIFSGLAWSFIFGIFASTAFSLYVVPLVYFLINRNSPNDVIPPTQRNNP